MPSKPVLGPEGIYTVVSEGDKITIKKKDTPISILLHEVMAPGLLGVPH